MNVFYLLKTLYTDGVTNGAISIDTKEKPVVWIGSSHPKSILGWTSIFVQKKMIKQETKYNKPFIFKTRY